jgi:hypothetical protein
MMGLRFGRCQKGWFTGKIDYTLNDMGIVAKQFWILRAEPRGDSLGAVEYGHHEVIDGYGLSARM